MFVIPGAAISHHKPETNRVSSEINFYFSGIAQHQLKISDGIWRTAAVVTSPDAKKCEPAVGMQRAAGGKYLKAAKDNWWKYIHLYSFLYIQYIIYFE